MRDRPALDVVIQGAGGVMSVTGEPDGPPLKPGLSLADIAGGLFGAVGILAALRERETSGRGQLVDISMLDCQLAVQENAFLRYHHLTGQLPQPLGTRHSWAVPFQAFPTADGYIVVALAWGVPNQWALLCSELDAVELIDDPRFAEAHARSANHAELEPLLNEAFRKRTTAEWVERLTPYEIPCGPLNNIAEAAAQPQVEARGMLTPVEHHTLGTLPLVDTADQALAHPGRSAGRVAGHGPGPRGRSSPGCSASTARPSTRSSSARWCGTSDRRPTSVRFAAGHPLEPLIARWKGGGLKVCEILRRIEYREASAHNRPSSQRAVPGVGYDCAFLGDSSPRGGGELSRSGGRVP